MQSRCKRVPVIHFMACKIAYKHLQQKAKVLKDSLAPLKYRVLSTSAFGHVSSINRVHQDSDTFTAHKPSVLAPLVLCGLPKTVIAIISVLDGSEPTQADHALSKRYCIKHGWLDCGATLLVNV